MKFVDSSLIRRALLYLVTLGAAAVAVFLATYLFGRHPSLEAELERLTAPRVAPDPGKSRGIPSLQLVEVPPETSAVPPDSTAEPLGAGIVASRAPLERAGMVVVADLPALAAVLQDSAPSLAGGIAAFLSRPPGGLQLGVRALAGAAGECGATHALSRVGQPAGDEFARALDPASGLGVGPRNPAGAVQAAVDDLSSLAGEQCIVIVAGGDEGCGADLCGAAAPPVGSKQRVHVLLLAPRPQSGTDQGMPDAGSAQAPRPVFDPAWAAPYRCLAERSGGSVAAVSAAEELEAALRRIAGTLEAAVVVRGFHYTGQEIKGVSPGGSEGWGVTLRLGSEAGAQSAESDHYPSAFAVTHGVYVVKARYGGQERTAAVAVASAERAEVRVTFATGELFLQALDVAGREIVGDSTGFRCAWGADVFQAGAEESAPVTTTCSFPARLELAPGNYRVRARWKGVERVVDEVAIEAGASAVRAISFARVEN